MNRVREDQGAVTTTFSSVVHPSGYRWYAVACGTLLIASAVVLAAIDPPPVALLVALVALLVLTEQRDRLFGDETSISSSIVVAMAAVVAFNGEGNISGPLLCAAGAGLYWPHLRDHAFTKIAINAFSMGTAALLAALTFDAVVGASTPSLALTCLAIVPASFAFWLSNSGILAGAVALLSGERLLPTTWVLIRSETEMLFFAVGGAACGYLMAYESTVLGLVGLVALLGAVDVLVIRRPRGAARIGGPVKRVRTAIPAAVGVAGVVTVAVLPAFEPWPDVLVTIALAGIAATVAALHTLLPLPRRLAIGVCISLVAVGALYDSSPILGPGLVAIAGGVVLALGSRRTGITRGLTLVGTSVIPALAAGAGAAAVPVHPSDGIGSMVVVAIAASFAALIAWVATTSTALAGAGLSGVFVALGDVAAEWWIVVVGAAAAVAAWYSPVAGCALAVLIVLAAVWLERRMVIATPVEGPTAHLSDEAVVDAITAALCDRPGAPTSLPSS